MKTKHPIDGFFQNNLENHEAQPSASVWENIEDELGEEKKKGIVWMQAAAIALLTGLGGTLFYQNINTQPGDIYTPRSEENRIVYEEIIEPLKAVVLAKQAVEPNNDPRIISEVSPRKKVVPVPQTNLISYEKTESKLDVSEAMLWTAEEEMAEEIEPMKKQVKDLPALKFKMKVATVPSTNYASVEPKKDLKDKVFAYAGSQVDNLLQGKKLEAPKVEKKPRLELKLDEIFN